MILTGDNTYKRSGAAYAGYMLVLFVSMVVTLFCLAAPKNSVYDLLPILPISFAIMGTFVIAPMQRSSRSWTILIFFVCSFLRYVVMPFVLCSDPCLIISSYALTKASCNDAVLYMAYELIVMGIGLKVFQAASPKLRTPFSRTRPMLIGERGGVVLKAFVAIALFIFVFVPASRQGLSFVALDAGTGVRASGEVSTFANVTRQLVLMGLLVAFVLVAVWAARENARTKSRLYYCIALLCALACVSVVVDEKRSVQIYCAFAAIVLITALFPKKRKQTVLIIVGLATLLIAVLTVYKYFYVFQYGSYSEALSQSSSFAGLGKTLDLYLLGPAAVASGLDSAGMQNQNIGAFLYDMARSFIGVSFLVKDSGMQTAGEIYNLFVSGGLNTSGLLLPIGVEAGICSWLPLGPLLPLVFVVMAVLIERKIRSADSPFWIFFLSYIYIRFATCTVSAALSSVFLAVSSVIVIIGALALAQSLLRKREVLDARIA